MWFNMFLNTFSLYIYIKLFSIVGKRLEWNQSCHLNLSSHYLRINMFYLKRGRVFCHKTHHVPTAAQKEQTKQCLSRGPLAFFAVDYPAHLEGRAEQRNFRQMQSATSSLYATKLFTLDLKVPTSNQVTLSLSSLNLIMMPHILPTSAVLGSN